MRKRIDQMHNPFSLKNKTILVTGASSGIGKACAIEIAKMGARLIISGRDESRLQATLDEIGGNSEKVVADFSYEDEIDYLISRCGRVDGVVHSAGIVEPKLFQFIDREYIDKLLDINFYSPVIITQKLYKNKQLTKGSSVIFISSISGNLVTSIGNSIYSGSKGALNGVAKGMALEFANRNIRVNTIMPGMIDTELFKGTAISQEDLQKDIAKYPLGRYGTTKDVAFACIYFLSDVSSWVTGTNFLIDGGVTLV